MPNGILTFFQIHHSSTINSSQSTVSTASNNDSMLTKNPTQSFAKCCDDKTTGYICENNILVNETHSNLAILNSFMNYNNPTLKPSRKSRINYPVATSRPRTTWVSTCMHNGFLMCQKKNNVHADSVAFIWICFCHSYWNYSYPS